jgi:single-strand DNA-binding protein
MSTVVTFAGDLAADPELLYTRDNKLFVACRVLVNRRDGGHSLVQCAR